MKHSYLFIVGLMLFLMSCAPENRVIEKPIFLASNTTSIEVSKVTLTDTTTVLDIFARYTPKHWIRVASTSLLTDDKGNEYPIQSGVGIELGKEFFMPESGEAEFQLVFPPLKRGAKSISFSEGPEVERGFSIWDIQLKEQKLPKLDVPQDLLAQEVDKQAALPEYKFSFGEATLKGRILDYKEGMDTQLQFVLLSPLGQDSQALPIEKDGSFSHTVSLPGVTATLVYLSGFRRSVEFFMAPGETSELYINCREMSRQRSKCHAEAEPYGKAYYYRGPLDNVVNEDSSPLLTGATIEKSDWDFDKKPEALLEEYKQYAIANYEKQQQAIASSTLGEAEKAYKSLHIKLALLYSLQAAPGQVASIYVRQTKCGREAYIAFYEKLSKASPVDYIPAELYEVLNNPNALLFNEHGNITRQAAYSNVSLEEKCGEAGVCSQVVAAAKLYAAVKDFQPLTDKQKEEMKSLPEAYQQYLLDANDKLLQTLEANKKKTGFTINEVGKVNNEKLFASIISKFRGKVLLVDFWATWCGPCRAANKEMIPMKEELKDKDIVYVYVTGETSPLGTWQNMITDIHGEHFRVTDAQWDYLRTAMGIEGVPTYFVVDREGGIKYKSVGFPGVNKMKEELLKVVDAK